MACPLSGKQQMYQMRHKLIIFIIICMAPCGHEKFKVTRNIPLGVQTALWG
jgi:hypothetical protein